jgi:hypothetical protein
MKAIPLNPLLSSICLWLTVIPVPHLSAADAPTDWVQISNAFTNFWSGHWEAVLVQSLSNRRILDFESGHWELNTSRKIQRSKLMQP